MTGTKTRESIGPGRLILCLALLFLHALFLRNHRIATEAVIEGLALSARAVVPSLFPSLVLSSMLVEGNMERTLFAPLARRFGINPSALCALLLSLLCGAPVGAKALDAACEKGALSKEKAERLLCLVGCPSLPFVVGTVGGVFLGNLTLGWLLWLSTLPGLALSALLFCRNCDKKTSLEEPPPAPQTRLSPLLAHGIGSATKSVLRVSAYVVFFSALFATFRYLFAAFALPPALSAFFYCFTELSGGLQEAAALPNAIALPLSGFAVGFSGLSVLFQVLSLTDRQGLSAKFYLPAKLLQGGLAAVVFSMLCRLM